MDVWFLCFGDIFPFLRHHDPPRGAWPFKKQTPIFQEKQTPIFFKNKLPFSKTKLPFSKKTNSHFRKNTPIFKKKHPFLEKNFNFFLKETLIFGTLTTIFSKKKLPVVISGCPFGASVSNSHFQASFKLNRCKKRKTNCLHGKYFNSAENIYETQAKTTQRRIWLELNQYFGCPAF